MIGVILAAGIGSRLRPMTNHKPKCLVETAGKTLLQYQLDAYKAAGIKDLCIVVGYEKESIYKYCRHIKDFNIEIIENNDYELTNNMYSFYLAREYVKGKPFILNNADLCIEESIVKKLVDDVREDLIAVDTSTYNNESMKVSTGLNNVINGISKDILRLEALGCSIDYYKFGADACETFIAEVEEIVERQGNLKDWTEVALNRLFQQEKLAFEAFDVAGSNWVEVDDYEDLALSDLKFSGYLDWQAQIQHYYLDLDGTIYLEQECIDGAADKLRELNLAGKHVYLLSNNSSKSKQELVQKLASYGIETSCSRIILSTDAVVDYLIKSRVKKVFVLGTASFSSEIENSGIELSENDPEFVLVGYDTELNYEKLSKACKLINRGIDYISTHPDTFCPTPSGPIPDAGAIVKLIEATTGVAPKCVFGKPSPDMILSHMEKNNIDKSNSIVVGDRLHTDIRMANEVGVKSALVLTGETARDMLEQSQYFPDVILGSITKL